MPKKTLNIQELLKENKRLQKELKTIKTRIQLATSANCVSAPKKIIPFFIKSQKIVQKYFESLSINPEKGMILVGGERYILVRASALSYDFLKIFKSMYADRGEDEATAIAKNLLFDMAHFLGIEDAKKFHKKMSLKTPIEKLSAGPVLFAFNGWAQVEILSHSNPVANENLYLKYSHPNSFEAESWLQENKKSTETVCIMNAGYSSGWCEESFNIPLTSVEISCKAKGDDRCTFIMAPPNKIEKYLGKVKHLHKMQKPTIPTFLERKKIEEALNNSLKEKDLLLKEVHHRVKNNLQVVASLLNLQSKTFTQNEHKDAFKESINRINSMAVIHELLYSSGDLSKIMITDFIHSLVHYIADSYPLETKIKFDVKIKTKRKVIDLDKSIPCGLILNELLSNCLKYAFKGKEIGNIQIVLKEFTLNEKETCELVVKDNGVGFPKDINISNPKSFGLQIINSLVLQLNGTFNIEVNNGTTFTVRYST